MQENTVYHYTSLETLYHIINDANEKNLKLRATHIDFLNDYSEHTIAIRLLKDELIKYDNSLEKHKSKDFQNKLNDKRMSFFRNEELDEMYPHIISFSECWDSLPMWNNYANASKGVALGFDKTKLLQLKPYRFDKCIYDSVEYEKYLKENIKTLHRCTTVDLYSTSFKKSFDSEILKKHFKFLPILKDKSYEYEQEHRLIIPNKMAEKEQLKFQTSDMLLKPYKEVLIPFEYLTEIVLGPTLNLEKLKTSLGLFLSQKNKNLSLDNEIGKIHLRKSEIPFRAI